MDTAKLHELAYVLAGPDCSFILGTEQAPFMGGEYILYVFENTARARFCIRLPLKPTMHTVLRMEHEASFCRRIDIEQLPLFQWTIACDTTSNDPLHTPYFALGWAEGVPLSWTDSTPAEEGDRKKILHAIGQSSIDLLRVCTEGNITMASGLDSHDIWVHPAVEICLLVRRERVLLY